MIELFCLTDLLDRSQRTVSPSFSQQKGEWREINLRILFNF